MLETLLRMVGVDLQAQAAQLRHEVQDFKDRTTREIKEEAAKTGVTVGLALVGFVFVMWTIVIALIALFIWIDDLQGPFVALGVVGLVTAISAGILIAVAASRGGTSSTGAPQQSSSSAAAAVAPPPAEAPQAAFTASPDASFLDAVTQHLSHHAAGATSEVLDEAADIVRRGPKEAVIATLAAAVVVGIFFGRRS